MAARGIHPARLDPTPEERATLVRWTRRGSTAQALALRARIVLACADRPEESHGVLARELGVHRATIGAWRRRFAARRLEGLRDDPRTGAPRRIGDADVERAITTTLEQAPPDATRWSTRGLAKAVGMSRTTVGRIWRAFGLQPAPERGVQALDRPAVREKVRDIVGLYLDPPARALVLCVDEKPQIQATRAPRPALPMRPGQPERHTHDYVRHGTRDLFAALDVKAGTVIGEVHGRHRSVEFRHFLDTVDANTPPELDLHLILDNAATHKTELIRRWVLKRPACTCTSRRRRLVAQPRRVLVLAPAAPRPRGRRLREHGRTRGGAARLRRRDQRRPQAVRLDQDR
jgi:transposase